MSALRTRGFSLVELMVAMTISLILLAGILSVVYSSKVTYRESERVARLQENGRTAVEMMLRDMRAGGFRGCTRTVPFTNTLNSSTALLWNFGTVVQGYDYVGTAGSTATNAWAPDRAALIASPLPSSDIVAVRTVRPNMPSFVTNAPMASTTSDVTVDREVTTDTLPEGRTVLISDCNAAAVFAVSTFTGSGTTATLQHVTTGTGAGPGNQTQDIGFEFQAGAQVVPVDTVIYYIRASETLRDIVNPSLWRIVGNGAAQELIEGVEAMQVQYGRDNNADRIVDEYIDAAAGVNWDEIVSVTFSMLIRSVEPTATDSDPRTFDLLGVAYGPFADRFERTIYTTTVTLRNTTS
jgi:type IV pilus assembly protein PilW